MASRRDTLSAISQSTLNSRTSMGPARIVSKPAQQRRMTIAAQSKPGRPSDARMSISRRSSVMSKGPTAKSDPRPVQDKAYMSESIRMLIQYLTEHYYDRPLSPKLFQAISSKEFFYIVQFLYNQIDPAFEYPDKPEEGVIAIFKKLRYPFTITKGSLVSVGTKHAWPPLLAALRWLAEILMYEEDVMEKDPGSFGISGDQSEFFEYTTKAYVSFLNGIDEDENEAKLYEQFAQNTQKLKDEVTSLETSIAEASNELATLQSQPTPLTVITGKCNDFKSDIEKFKKLIDSLQQHKASLEAKLEEKNEEFALRQKEMAALKSEKEQLAQRLAVQEQNAVDLQKMTSERTMLEESLRNVEDQKAQIDQSNWNVEVTINKKMEEASRGIQGFNNKCERLQMLPVGAKNAPAGTDFEIRMNKYSSKGDDLVSIDIKSVLIPALNEVRQTFVKRQLQSQDDILTLQDKLSDRDDAKTEKEVEIESLENKLKRCDNALKLEKEAIAEQLRIKAAETNNIEDEIQNLRILAQDQLGQSKQAIDKAQAEYEETQRQCEAQKSALSDGIFAMLDTLTNHKAYLQENLTALEDRLKQMQGEMTNFC
eukprot:GFYU01012446.1.p1 GENE.GFYU01012446.1~~GFYU01012446.1.p1  ORF type:complete len:596 (+),score=258.35 GFYU01012446.1:138-1925(+)